MKNKVLTALLYQVPFGVLALIVGAATGAYYPVVIAFCLGVTAGTVSMAANLLNDKKAKA